VLRKPASAARAFLQFKLRGLERAVNLLAMKNPLTEEPPTDGPVTWEDVSALMEELKRMARGFLGKEGRVRPIKTIGLVLSAFRRLAGAGKDYATPPKRDWEQVSWADREEFFRHARRAMFQALVDYARERKRRREHHAGGFQPEELATLIEAGALPLECLAAPEASEALVALGEALIVLERDYPDLAAVVQHRYFGHLNLEEIAGLLDVSEKTVRNRLDRSRVTLAELIRRQTT
jgi:DNA-directed RNA polymerase specialized sigma24 family protein